ncbi:putative protein SERAC1 [Rosellinia necatrix]|uniref:DUF676 domain-containing protein n=1 Tax=Rosellinia necatrix TaxID=77044 RepID=A0A1W2TL96_ROSNE|nr:putative protein SERAC1 [Rosellinia necatrix]
MSAPHRASRNTTARRPYVKCFLDKAYSRIIYHPRNKGHDVDFLFIHDAVIDPGEAWQCYSSAEIWPALLKEEFPTARVLIYQYKRNWIKTLDDIVNPEHLHKVSTDLFMFLSKKDIKSSVPLIVFAHGFGGLLYEQALVDSENQDHSGMLHERTNTAFLFGTPHFGAGIAEWAIIMAQLHGFPCAKTAQGQDWSALEHHITKIETMQRRLRQVLQKADSKPKITACFSTLGAPGLSPEWAALPEYLPIAVDRAHSSMTMFHPKEQAFKAIMLILKTTVSQALQH